MGRGSIKRRHALKKSALFGFNGDPMCFIHVLLNALDMKDKGETVCIVVEGSATKLIDDLSKKDNPLHTLWEKAKAQRFGGRGVQGMLAKNGHHRGRTQSGAGLA